MHFKQEFSKPLLKQNNRRIIMIMKVVRYFMTPTHEGLVRIGENKTEFSQTGVEYMGYWMPPAFTYELNLPQTTAPDLEETIRRLKVWDPKICELKDFGEMILWDNGFDGDALVVSCKESSRSRQLFAKDVKQGTYLDRGAENFFILWKGEKAIGSDHRLVETHSQEDE